jgi:hypothetical protein
MLHSKKKIERATKPTTQQCYRFSLQVLCVLRKEASTTQ